MFKRLLGSRSGKTIGDGITVSEKELGAGGFSKVYEGTLRDGTPYVLRADCTRACTRSVRPHARACVRVVCQPAGSSSFCTPSHIEVTPLHARACCAWQLLWW
ncbi:hypothetical protein EON67_05815 [archaeon]|nr:MAG: hypothetical protein EON67_05815 [archaeon]